MLRSLEKIMDKGYKVQGARFRVTSCSSRCFGTNLPKGCLRRKDHNRPQKVYFTGTFCCQKVPKNHQAVPVFTCRSPSAMRCIKQWSNTLSGCKEDSAGILYTNNLIRSGKPKRCVHTAKAGWLPDSCMVFSSNIEWSF